MSFPLRPTPATPEAQPASRKRALREVSVVPPDHSSEWQAQDRVFDVSHLRELFGFPFRSVRRHPVVALGVFALAAVATGFTVSMYPRQYSVEMVMIAQANGVMAALDNPRRSVPSESNAPIRLATESVLSRDNLHSIIDQTGLLRTWTATRSPLGKLREKIMEVVVGTKVTDADRVKALTEMLQARLWVTSAEKDYKDGTMRIGILWPERYAALRIVQTAQQNFVEQRHANEVAQITESIGILQSHLVLARQAIDEAMTALRQASPARAPDPVELAGLIPTPKTSVDKARLQQVSTLQAQLSAKRAAIADLEHSRNQRMAALQTQLTELQSTYGPAHPEVVSIQESIRALGTSSPQLDALHADEASLTGQLSALGALDVGTPSTAPGGEALLNRAILERLARGRPDTLEDPKVTYAKSRLKIAVANYEDLLDRLESAHIELETTRAAFKYRYVTVKPPEIPKRPVTPNVARLAVGGTFLGVLLAVFAATALDLVGGRIIETWQIERRLGIPLLGESTTP
jgi:uncharacterized protein involved in exopolysaccharide biosynthesis